MLQCLICNKVEQLPEDMQDHLLIHEDTGN